MDQLGESEEDLIQEGNEEDGKTLLEEELREGWEWEHGTQG